MKDDDALGQLAMANGILASYRDMQGRERFASPDTLRATKIRRRGRGAYQGRPVSGACERDEPGSKEDPGIVQRGDDA